MNLSNIHAPSSIEPFRQFTQNNSIEGKPYLTQQPSKTIESDALINTLSVKQQPKEVKMKSKSKDKVKRISKSRDKNTTMSEIQIKNRGKRNTSSVSPNISLKTGDLVKNLQDAERLFKKGRS